MPIVKVDFRQQKVPHQAIWFSESWQRKQGFEFKHCKICGAGEDVHIAAPEQVEEVTIQKEEPSEAPENGYVTDRGFTGYAQFVDLYGTLVRVQESSLASEPAVWIFSTNEKYVGMDPHLSVEQAIIVRDGLDAFIKEARA